MIKGILTLVGTGALVLLTLDTQAEVRLPKVFSSHMVLQQNKPVVIWGWADPGEQVEARIGGAQAKATANAAGEWKLSLPAVKPGEPQRLTVSGSNRIELDDVLVGEVWLASGQSNMEMGISSCKNGKEEIAAANYPQIRLLMVPNRWTPQSEKDIEAAWKVCSPETIAEGGWGGFSAGAYYFGRELHQKLKVPVGLIDATWGGTRIESWTPPEGFAAVPALAGDYERVQLGDPRSELHQQRLETSLQEVEAWLQAARQALKSRSLVPAMPTYPGELLPPRDVQHSTALYNGMIHPLCPLAIAGAIWYQGESNSGEGMLYTERMKALVGGWRKIWNDSDLPFYFVQIAPYDYKGNPEVIGEFWEAQAAAADQIPSSGMAVINDIGDLKDIHPTNKQEVGRRLALMALAKRYGQKDLVCTGPTFKSMRVEGNTLRVEFNNVAGGLKSRDGKDLTWFEIIDAEEGPFVAAQARIDRATVVLSAPEVKNPVAMRFAWSMLAEPNLQSSEGLPAGAFRAGTAPNRDFLALKIPEARNYKMVYDLDLSKLGPNITYDADLHNRINQPIDRVAYFVELTDDARNTQYVFVSMDAFTQDLGKLGIPTLASGAKFQQAIANMNVFSNVKGVVNGTGLAGGNLEFWPHNYGTGNSANVPNASAQEYDFGDDPSDPADGYGCMQVHNHEAKQTLFAINHWKEGAKADIGLGNQGTASPDWTFSANAGSYQTKRLRVLVKLR